MADLTQIPILHGGQPMRLGKNCCRLHRPIQRTGVDGRDVIVCQPVCEALCLRTSLLGEKNIRCAREAIFCSELRCTMPDQIETGCHRKYALSTIRMNYLIRLVYR